MRRKRLPRNTQLIGYPIPTSSLKEREKEVSDDEAKEEGDKESKSEDVGKHKDADLDNSEDKENKKIKEYSEDQVCYNINNFKSKYL